MSSSCGMETLVEIIVHAFVSGGLVQKSCQIYRVRGPPVFSRFFNYVFHFFFSSSLIACFLSLKKKKKNS